MANPFSAIGENLVGTIFTGIFWFIGGFIILGIVGAFLLWLRHIRKFDISVKIISLRAKDKNAIIFDRASILTDKKDGTKYFRLLKQKTDLPVPPFNVLQSSSRGDYLELWRKSDSEFLYLTPPEISKTFAVRSDGKLYPMATTEMKQLEGDIAFWNIKRKAQNKNLFDSESMMMKLLPHLPAIIGGIMTLFILYVLFDSLPTILQELSRLTGELASLKGGVVNTA